MTLKSETKELSLPLKESVELVGGEIKENRFDLFRSQASACVNFVRNSGFEISFVRVDGIGVAAFIKSSHATRHCILLPRSIAEICFRASETVAS